MQNIIEVVLYIHSLSCTYLISYLMQKPEDKRKIWSFKGEITSLKDFLVSSKLIWVLFQIKKKDQNKSKEVKLTSEIVIHSWFWIVQLSMENGSVDPYQKYVEGNFTVSITSWGRTYDRHRVHHQTSNLAAGGLICCSWNILA